MNQPLRTIEELNAGLELIRQSPSNSGVVRMISRRPASGEREVLETAELDLERGLVGDSWRLREGARKRAGASYPDMQLTLMNSRVIDLIACRSDRWQLAGDQLFVDFDLSFGNLPSGTRLVIGKALIEITAPPHTGCKQFAARFGPDARKFVNSELGKQLRLRGANARVIRPGVVSVSDTIAKA